MGNIFSKRKYINYELVLVHLSDSLSDIVRWKYLRKIEKQINKMPQPIPRIKFVEDCGALENSFDAKRSKSGSLISLAKETNVAQIFVAYEPGETYSIGNTVGRVWDQTANSKGETPSGLILLNDKRLQQVSAGDDIYLANLILHEVLHVYGLAHAKGMVGFEVRNQPVMNLGKFGYVGLSHDDRAVLKENYEVPVRGKNITVTIKTNGDSIGLFNRDNSIKSQGKELRNGVATFTHLKQGKYTIYVDGIKVKNQTLRKNKEIDLT